MLDLKFIRENIDVVKKAIRDKGESVDISRFEELDRRRRELIKERDTVRAKRKKLSFEIGKEKQRGKVITRVVTDTVSMSDKLKRELKGLEKDLKEIEGEIDNILRWIPNIPHLSVPRGDKNLIIREWGDKRKFDFEPLNCLDLCNSLGILDFERGSKVSGSHFPCYKGLGARLERALVNFMIDLHVKQGYTEIFPPFLANRDSMFSTGQLPKMEEDMYLIEKDDLFLNPTAEVPVTSLHMREVLREEDLPIKYVAYTACFRREAGAYGKKTRGLKRVHQFNKVELIKFAKPEHSYEELESLLEDAERVLKLLNIPYRVALLSTKDMSFASAKTYDIEVWAPVTGEYLEVSSATNFEDFQARRGNIRYREKGGKTRLVHTLNASGIATPRTFIALVENYQQEDGSIRIPDVLVPYMGGIKEIR